MKKRILSCLMALALCLTLLPATALATDGDHTAADHADPTKFTELKMVGNTLKKGNSDWTVDADSGYLMLEAGKYYLSTDLTLTDPIGIFGTNVTLCLNSKTIKYTGAKDYAILVDWDNRTSKNSGHLTLTDCSGNNAGTIKGGSSEVVELQADSDLDMYGGTITGSRKGVDFSSEGTEFNMHDGVITGNSGYGVYMTAGTFNMSGGAITGNGNGVHVNNDSRFPSTFNVNGAPTITNNGKDGTTKNVYLREGQTIHVTGAFTGTIGVTAQTPSAGTSIVTVSDANYIKGTFTSDNGAYGISKDSSGNIVLKEHNWNYTQSGAETNTITANCTECGVSGGSVTLTAPAADTLTYNGKAKQAKLTANDWLGADVKKIEITYRKCSDNICRLIDTDPTDAGKYTASIKLGEATASVGYTIKKAKLTVTAKDTTITYGNELTGSGVKYTGLVSGDKLGGTLDYDYTYTQYGDVNGGSYTITPKGLSSNNYEIAYASGKLTVLPREVTLTWKNTENRTVGDGKGPVTAEAGNLVNGDEIGVTIYNGALPNAAGRSTVTATDLTGEKAGNYKLPAETSKEYEIGKAAAKVTTAPQALEPTYTGEAQALVSAGAAEGGKLVYSTTENGTYKETIPTGTDADTYKVWYKVEGDETHSSTAPVELEVTIAPKALTAADITVAEIASTTYTGKDITPTVTVKDGEAELKPNQDYTVSYTDNRNAGTATVTVTGKGNYTGEAKVEWKITKRTPALEDFNVIMPTELVYNGREKQVTVAPKNPMTYDGEVTVTYECGGKEVTEAKNAGTYTVKTIKLAEDDNFTAGTLKNESWSFTIKQEKYNGGTLAKTVNLVKNRDSAQSGTLTAADFFDGSAPEGAKITAVNPTSGTTMLDSVTAADGKLTYTSKTNIDKAADETYAVTIACTNYEGIVAHLTFRATNKIVPTGTPTLSKTTLAWGEQLSTIALSGAMTDPTDSTKTVKGKFEWVAPGAAKEKIGEYEVAWKFTPDENAVYTEAAGTVTITVTKATPKGAPGYTKITTTGKTLKDASLTAGTIQPEGTIQWELDETTVVTANTAYKWVFTPNDKEHYKELTGFITPYSVSSNTGGSSSGGSSSGGSSSSDRDDYDSNPVIKTETKNNPDGSTTKTETRRDGSVTATTTGKDGSVSKTETKPDGSSVTENKAADGSTGTVKTDKNGQTEAKTALSNKAIEDAKKNGEAVKAPVEVEAFRNSNTAPTVKVELPKGAGETKVEIPVSNVNAGTVAVLVHPDGTEEILKDSIPTEDGIRLTVDGGATVKIVDNSKDFIDTRNHWAREEIDFVSARELVNGVSDTIYAPNASATRAQLWTILARQNDADLSGGANWYEKAQLWSKDKGISDGTEPNAAINRAQMVTMLWRTMGQPTATDKVSFADVPAGSYYAQAVAWAVESGITAGVGGGRFDPSATCTRAQIAAFLARSMK